MTAIRTALTDARQQAVATGPPQPITITQQYVRKTCSEARDSLAGYMTPSSWQDLEQTLCSVVSCLEGYDQTVSAGKWEELDLLAVLGSARVSVGLCLVHLMCPSPVDPIVTARTKYQCLEHQVREGWEEGRMEGWRGHNGMQ